jgi:hypothetical protein
MSNQNPPPGLIQPTVLSLPAGATGPHDAAKAMNDANNLKLHNINQMSAGRRRRRHRGGDNSQVTVPVIKPIYTSQNGPGTDTTAQQAQGQSINMQSTANKVFDNQATKMGGSRRRKRGGNADWLWGCYSGGRRRTHRRKTRKHKKKTRTRRRY